MAKRADVELRIRSKNLAAKDLSELNTELDKFVKNQERQADSAALASRSLRDLNTEQRELSKIAAELARRRSLIETLIGKQSDLNAAKTRVNALRQELAELLSMKSKGTFLGDINKAIKSVKTDLATAEKAFDRTAASTEKLDGALKAIGVDTTDLSSSLNQVTSSLNRAQAAVIDQTADINRLGQAQADAAQDARKLAEAQRFANEQAARQSVRRADAVAGFAGLDEFNAQRAAAAASTAAIARQGTEVARVQGIHDRFNAVLARNPQYQRALAASTQQGTTAVDQQGRAADRTRSSIDRYNRASGLLADTGRKSLSVYQRIRGEVLSLAAAYVGLYQAVAVFANAMKVAQQRQAINAQLLTVNSGNARLAARDQKFLREEAERLGLVYDDLAKKYANFAISAKAAGLGDSATKEAFSQAADIVVGMRLAAEDADGVFRAFVQIMSKSRVQAEELRGQLGDRLPGAVAAFAKANNLALSDLDEFLKKGKGNVETFLKFLQAYAATVKDSVESGSRTVFADINRLKTAYNDFLELVATSGTSAELQKAVTSLTNALKGQEGKKFAEELAAAFTAVVKALQFVIEHFDTFLTLAKLFIGLQFVKGIIGLGASFFDLGKGIVTAVSGLRTLYTAAVAARTAGAALTLSQSSLLAVLGPVGIALAAVTAALYGMQRAAAAADARMEAFIGTMRTARSVQNSLDVDVAEKGVRDQLDETKAKLQELQQIQRDSTKWAPSKQFSSAIGMVKNDLYTTEALEIAITTEQQKQEGLQVALANLGKKRAQFKAKEAEEDRKIREQEEAAAKAAAAAAAKGEDDGKKKKGPTERQIRAEENARLNASRAIQKELLDLDQAIFDARIDGEVRTADQIQKNYELTIRKIESQIAEQQLNLDRLEQNAKTAGAGTVSPEDAAAIQAARERVAQLNLALNARAMESSLLQDVAVGDKKVNDLIAERDAKIDAINTKVEVGLLTEAEGRRAALEVQQQYSAQIAADIDALVATLQALPPDLAERIGVPRLVAQLQAARLEATALKTEMQLIAENVGEKFAGGLTDTIMALAQGIGDFLAGVGSIGDAFDSAISAFRNFLSQFLAGIAKAIIQAIILQAIMNAIRGTSGGYGAAVSSALSSFHTGGIVGRDGDVWSPAGMVAKWDRFHDGGLPGLRSNEVPAVLEKGEEVLTAEDPRHAKNGGGQNVQLNNINIFDREEVAGEVMKANATGTLLLNFFGRNSTAIRQRLGV